MNFVEARSKRRETRRRILGWLGLGAIGAMAFRILPVKISKRVVQRKSKIQLARYEKVPIEINKSAVKRIKLKG